MAQSLSSLRAQLLELMQNAQQLSEAFLDTEPLLPGSLYTLKRRCGKPNCRCTKGELHHTQVLSYRGGQVPQTITPASGQLEAIRQWTDAYRRFRQARAQLVKLHRQMLQLIDRIEAQRVRHGKQKFRTHRRRPSASKPQP
jgi:hypothetical protein